MTSTACTPALHSVALVAGSRALWLCRKTGQEHRRRRNSCIISVFFFVVYLLSQYVTLITGFDCHGNAETTLTC